MPRICTICTHADLERIDSAIVANESNRSIASQFQVSASAVQRHAETHLPALLVKAHEAATIAQADTLLEQVQKTQARVLGWLDSLEKAKDWKAVFQASKEFRGYLSLVGQLTGQLANGTNVNVNVSGMGSPGSAGADPEAFTAQQLGEVLAGLPPDQLQEALTIAREIHEAERAAELVAEQAVRPVQALPGVQSDPVGPYGPTPV